MSKVGAIKKAKKANIVCLCVSFALLFCVLCVRVLLVCVLVCLVLSRLIKQHGP